MTGILINNQNVDREKNDVKHTIMAPHVHLVVRAMACRVVTASIVAYERLLSCKCKDFCEEEKRDIVCDEKGFKNKRVVNICYTHLQPVCRLLWRVTELFSMEA
jgi:hypothetical protein